MFNTIKDKEKKILSYIWPTEIRNTRFGIMNYKHRNRSHLHLIAILHYYPVLSM